MFCARPILIPAITPPWKPTRHSRYAVEVENSSFNRAASASVRRARTVL
jgi:hypothetical protein